MSYTEIIICRLAIQICVGFFPNGRKRRRTFSIKGIRPDASEEAIAAVVRALAPVLACPIIKVRKVVKRTIVFDDWAAPAAAPLPVSAPVRAALEPLAVLEPEVPGREAWDAEEFAAAALFALTLLRLYVRFALRAPRAARLFYMPRIRTAIIKAQAIFS